jgi:hypothetical protein
LPRQASFNGSGDILTYLVVLAIEVRLEDVKLVAAFAVIDRYRFGRASNPAALDGWFAQTVAPAI